MPLKKIAVLENQCHLTLKTNMSKRPMTVPPELVSEPLIPDIHVDNDSADEHNKRKNPRLPSGTKYG